MSFSKLSKSGVGETLDVVHPEAKFLFLKLLNREQDVCLQDTVGQA